MLVATTQENLKQRSKTSSKTRGVERVQRRSKEEARIWRGGGDRQKTRARAAAVTFFFFVKKVKVSVSLGPERPFNCSFVCDFFCF